MKTTEWIEIDDRECEYPDCENFEKKVDVEVNFEMHDGKRREEWTCGLCDSVHSVEI
jgi:hypothetical protein